MDMKSTIQEEQKSIILNTLRNEALNTDLDADFNIDLNADIDEEKIKELTSGNIPGTESSKTKDSQTKDSQQEQGAETDNQKESEGDTSKEDGSEDQKEEEAESGENEDTSAGTSPEPTLFEEGISEESTTETTAEPTAEPTTEPATEAGTEQQEPIWNKSGYIAVGALLAAIFLIIFRKLTSRKYSAKNSVSPKKEQSRKRLQALSDEVQTGIETEDVSDFGVSGAEKQGAPLGRKVPYSVSKVHAIGARKDQQDSYNISDYMDSSLLQEKGLLAIVADGMGGLSNGGMVSKLAVNTGMEYFYGSDPSLAPGRRLLEMVQIINNRVNQFLYGKKERSGSTLIEALICQNKLYFLTVGDSRIYLYRGGHMICLNRPHIYAEELALDGVNKQRNLSDMESDRQKASLTSYLGAGRLKHLDRNAEGISLVKGDKIMLCSDGVFGTLTEESMELALSKSPEEAAELLEQQVYVAGKAAQDNFTAVIIQCN